MVFVSTSNSCPSLWSKSPTSFLELEFEAVDLETCVNFLVAHEMVTASNRPWDGPVFWCLASPSPGMHSRSNKAMYPMAEESVVEKTLHLCMVKAEGDLGSSLIAGSWTQWRPVNNIGMNHLLVWMEGNLPPLEQLFLIFQQRLHAWPMGPVQGDPSIWIQ